MPFFPIPDVLKPIHKGIYDYVKEYYAVPRWSNWRVHPLCVRLAHCGIAGGATDACAAPSVVLLALAQT